MNCSYVWVIHYVLNEDTKKLETRVPVLETPPARGTGKLQTQRETPTSKRSSTEVCWF